MGSLSIRFSLNADFSSRSKIIEENSSKAFLKRKGVSNLTAALSQCVVFPKGETSVSNPQATSSSSPEFAAFLTALLKYTVKV